MPGLIDITPAVEVVDVRGHSVRVVGLNEESIGQLLVRFPKFRQMWETSKWDVNGLLKMSREGISAIIADSCDGAFSEQTASYLGLGERAEILAAVCRVTMPRGFGPFGDLMRAIGLVDGAASNMASATTSPSPSNSSNGTVIRKQKSTPQESLSDG